MSDLIDAHRRYEMDMRHFGLCLRGRTDGLFGPPQTRSGHTTIPLTHCSADDPCDACIDDMMDEAREYEEAT